MSSKLKSTVLKINVAKYLKHRRDEKSKPKEDPESPIEDPFKQEKYVSKFKPNPFLPSKKKKRVKTLVRSNFSFALTDSSDSDASPKKIMSKIKEIREEAKGAEASSESSERQQHGGGSASGSSSGGSFRKRKTKRMNLKDAMSITKETYEKKGNCEIINGRLVIRNLGESQYQSRNARESMIPASDTIIKRQAMKEIREE